MQVVYQNEDERSDSRETNSIGIIICIGRVSRYLEGKYFGGLGSRRIGLYNSRRISSRSEEGIW